jgi:hypothetical protein
MEQHPPDVLDAIEQLSEAIYAALLLDDVDLAQDLLLLLHALESNSE